MQQASRPRTVPPGPTTPPIPERPRDGRSGRRPLGQRSCPEQPQQVLAKLENDNDLYAMDAKYTLITFKAGKLDLDW